MAPTYEEVATNLKGIAIVAKIDATVEEGLAHKYGIKGFPTLKLFKPGSKKDDLQDYQGARSAAALISFVTGALSGSEILRVKSANVDSLWSQQPTSAPRVVLFSSKPEPSTLYKSLSMRFGDGQLVFAQVQQNDPLCNTYGVDTFPSLLVIPSQGADPIKFEGKFGADALIDFLTPHAGPAPGAAGSQGSAKATGSSSSSTTQQTVRPHTTTAATWKEANSWESLNEACGKSWCLVLLDRDNGEYDDVKSKAISLYGHEGKFQFVHYQGEDIAQHFPLDEHSADATEWIIYNGKKGKFAQAPFTGQVPTAVLDRIVGGDAKLQKTQ